MTANAAPILMTPSAFFGSRSLTLNTDRKESKVTQSNIVPQFGYQKRPALMKKSEPLPLTTDYASRLSDAVFDYPPVSPLQLDLSPMLTL